MPKVKSRVTDVRSQLSSFDLGTIVVAWYRLKSIHTHLLLVSSPSFDPVTNKQAMTQGNQRDAFQTLVDQLSAQLGPSSGIDSEDVDPEELQRLMAGYSSDQVHWNQYYFPSTHHAYTRNLVDKGNGKSNLVSELVSLATACCTNMK